MSLRTLPPPRTWPSIALRWLGSTFIAPPSDFGLPPPAAFGFPPPAAADFYAAPIDRAQPSKAEAQSTLGVWRPRIAVDTLRRDLAQRIAPLGAAVAAIVLLIAVGLSSGAQHVRSAWQAHEQRVAAAQAQAKAAAQEAAAQAAQIAATVSLLPPSNDPTPYRIVITDARTGGVWRQTDCWQLNAPLQLGYLIPSADRAKVAACHLPPAAFGN